MRKYVSVNILFVLYIVKFSCNITLLQGPMIEPAILIGQINAKFAHHK